MPFSHVTFPFENARCFLGSCRSNPPPLSIRSACRYVASRDTFGCGVHPRTGPHARNAAPPSLAPAPHGPALWSGRPIWLWGRGRCVWRPPPGLPPHGVLPRRGFVVERAWIEVAREAVGPEGRVVPQQWLSRTTAAHVRADDRHRLDFVVYGATTNGEALCCDATLVSPLTRTGPSPGPTPGRGSRMLRRAGARSHATRS